MTSIPVVYGIFDREVKRAQQHALNHTILFKTPTIREIHDVEVEPDGLCWKRASLEVPDTIKGGVPAYAQVEVARTKEHDGHDGHVYLRSTGVKLAKFEYEQIFGFKLGGPQLKGKIVRIPVNQFMESTLP